MNANAVGCAAEKEVLLHDAMGRRPRADKVRRRGHMVDLSWQRHKAVTGRTYTARTHRGHKAGTRACTRGENAKVWRMHQARQDVVWRRGQSGHAARRTRADTRRTPSQAGTWQSAADTWRTKVWRGQAHSRRTNESRRTEGGQWRTHGGHQREFHSKLLGENAQ